MSRTHDDPDNPPLTAAELARARRGIDHLPQEMQEALRAACRGRGPQKAPTKKLVTIRLSPDVITKYKKAGPGWQKRINDDLVRISSGEYQVVAATVREPVQRKRAVPRMHGGVLSGAASSRTKYASKKR